ncbi:MAG: YceI family protein [Rickettsiales bacterium]|nr:YceI family protein [Rickettsiales bacterium]
MKMFAAFIAIFLLAGQAVAADVATPTAKVEPGPVPKWNVVKEKSFVKFTATHNNAPVEGKFTGFDADIVFDGDRVKESHIRVEVDVTSLTMGDASIRDTLMTPEWLDTKKQAKAVFTSTEISRIPTTNDFYARGKLELAGVKKEVTMNFSLRYADDNAVVANGAFTLQRGEFSVGKGQWSRDDVVKQAVRVEFRVAANKSH